MTNTQPKTDLKQYTIDQAEAFAEIVENEYPDDCSITVYPDASTFEFTSAPDPQFLDDGTEIACVVEVSVVAGFPVRMQFQRAGFNTFKDTRGPARFWIETLEDSLAGEYA